MSVVKRLTDMNVLIVDDEDRICDLIKLFLEVTFKFHSIVSASNAHSAIHKIQNQNFDLIIIDQVLPNKPGLELIEQLKNSPKYSRIKIILISGYMHQEEVMTALKFGVRHIVVKPFTREQLVKAVVDILNITIR